MVPGKEKEQIRLSDATQGAKAELIDMLFLSERGAPWPNKPTNPERVNGFAWLKGESEENQQAYMKYLRNMLLMIPAQFDLADVELFRNMEESRKISRTTDVAIAKSKHVRNHAVRHNIETLMELKTPKNMKEKDHSPQTIGVHFVASYLNPSHAGVG